MKKLIILITSLVAVVCSLASFSCAKVPPAQSPAPIPPPEISFPQPSETPTPAPTPVPAPTLPPWSNVNIYTDKEKMISTSVNQEFAIALYSNPRLGSNWYETHDENMLALVESTFIAYNPSTPVDGTERFLFKALKPGRTEITITYRHGTTGPIREQQVFNVDIK